MLLDNGWIVKVPEEAQIGDFICIIRGTNFLCVLRETLEGRWTLVSGDCEVSDNERQGYGNDFDSEEFLEDHEDDLEVFRAYLRISHLTLRLL